ncbi:hypothetical protein MSG28_010629 [Choristoneura fumiferana]|uniref:Uncharacterized protein n=1 Tax=Choristoneura fumiferana TaxID=7141 RepID=A0ACC0KNZ3_CHOFU|nr:hypothetical protein MSG28_010629 [Choristoneura fumiferana]
MKFFMLIMALAINIVFSDGTCRNTNSQISANSLCATSTLTNCYIDDSQLESTTCTRSQYNGAYVVSSRTTNCNIRNSQVHTTTCTNSQYEEGVYITSSTTTNTRVTGIACSVSSCTITRGVVTPSNACRISGCILRAN